MPETWVQSPGWEDPLEKEMATHSSILAWENPMDRGAWWATVYGVTKSRTWLSTHINTPCSFCPIPGRALSDPAGSCGLSLCLTWLHAPECVRWLCAGLQREDALMPGSPSPSEHLIWLQGGRGPGSQPEAKRPVYLADAPFPNGCNWVSLN